MAKGKKTVYFCQNCGHEEAKWLGQCPMCKEWNTFVEERIDSGITKGTTVAARAVNEAKVVPLHLLHLLKMVILISQFLLLKTELTI